jgi:hypothetical protein
MQFLIKGFLLPSGAKKNPYHKALIIKLSNIALSNRNKNEFINTDHGRD